MVQEKKSLPPYKSITSDVIDGKLFIYVDPSDIEESIRFAYGLHLSILAVVHCIIVRENGEPAFASFQVNTPNHGK